MATKFIPNKIYEASLPSTSTEGYVYITEKKNFYVAASDGTMLKITDIEFVNVLPSEPIMKKLYLLSTNSSINVWNGTGWISYGAVNFVLQAASTTALGGVKSGGNGINIDGAGLISAKNGTGIKFDTSGNITADEANIDVTQLKNYSMLSLGSPKGFFDSSATLATFADSQKGSFWIYSGTTSATIGGVSFSTNDQLWCKTTFTGSPTDLSTNFVKVPYTLVQATTTTAGAVKLGSSTPLMDSSTAAVGTSTAMSREDHIHPSDTTKVSKLSTTTANGIVVFNNTTGDLKDSTKTLPTGVVVGTTDVQTVTNKTFDDSTTYFSDTTDNTKKVQIDAGGNTTGITGTLKTTFTTAKILSFPDSNGTLAVAPSNGVLSSLGNVTLVTNTVYDIVNTSVATSVLTLPTGTKTGDYIEILVSCSGFNSTTNFIIRGTINGATNDYVCNTGYTDFKFVWSANTATWVYAGTNKAF